MMTDLFCGAGGSSTGAQAVPGVRVKMAANLHVKEIEVPNPLVSPSLDQLLDVDGRSCTWQDPEDFFPNGQMAEDGKAICRPCPARADCLAYALLHDVDGIWGGTTYSERKALRDLHQIHGIEPVSIPASWLAPRRR